MSDTPKRCETCRGWNRQAHEFQDPRFGLCGGCDYGRESESDPECQMYVVDHEGWSASLFTREDFSCAAWKAKSDV